MQSLYSVHFNENVSSAGGHENFAARGGWGFGLTRLVGEQLQKPHPCLLPK